MWIYDRQDPETETLTHLETGVQVRREDDIICRVTSTLVKVGGGVLTEHEGEHEKMLVNCDSTDHAEKSFFDILTSLLRKGDLVAPAQDIQYVEQAQAVIDGIAAMLNGDTTK